MKLTALGALRAKLRTGGTWRSLAGRLYLLSIGSLAIIVLSYYALVLFIQPFEPRFTHYVLARLTEIEDPAARQREADHLAADELALITIYDNELHLVVTNAQVPHPPPTPAELTSIAAEGTLYREQATTLVMSVDSGGRRLGVAVVELLKPRLTRLDWNMLPPVLALLALLAVVFATTLARPLTELERAARSFGDGDLTARARIERAGAFSDLAHTFNEMAERVTASLRSEKQLLANISHELRTPLSRIRMALDLHDGKVQDAGESLGEIVEDLSELETIVEDVLTAARLDLRLERTGGGPPLRAVEVSPGELLDKAAARFRSFHKERALDVSYGTLSPSITVDPPMLRRVVDNLLDNAAKFSEPATLVQLRAHESGNELVIEVVDRGIGISREDLSRLFTPFFRADPSRGRQTGGVGLGLVLARRIVEAHGGTLELESVPREGTMARVRIPLTAA